MNDVTENKIKTEQVTDIENNGDGIVPKKGEPDDPSIKRVGFYNVENLFDLVDEPHKKDDDFTPEGRNEWNEEKYKTKIDHLAKVIHYMGQPGLMGLCEVENPTVLKDLINNEQIDESKYLFIHQDSPDLRGIDVALLYNPKDFKLQNYEFIRIHFPKEVVEDYTTRDFLHATFKGSNKKDIHVFVNHWPSRRGGVEASEPKRVYVAEQVRKEVDEIFKEDKNAQIILMGDFNDEPQNKSVNETLGAKPIVTDPEPKMLYDLMHEMKRKGLASYNYRGQWNVLDHIIVSGSLLDGKRMDVKKPQIFNRDWMLFYHKKTEQYRPSRTFSGGKYYAGYSDHLPVSAELVYD